VVLGCVTPVGEQGADIARTAVLDAGWAQQVAGVTQSRFCASGWSRSTWPRPRWPAVWEDLVVAGGVESMSRWPMGSDGGAWVMDPRVNPKTVLRAAGHGRRPDRHAGGFLAQPTWTPSRCARTSAPPRRGPKGTSPVHGAGARHRRPADAGPRRDHPRPATTKALAKLEPSFEMMGRWASTPPRCASYTTVERIEHVHHAGNSSGIVDGAALMLVGSQGGGRKAGLKPRARIRAAR
jgi:acetyl-CoA C-acetyltransferase